MEVDGGSVETSLGKVNGYSSPSVTSISCLYCKEVLSFEGLPAVGYADHLSSEHRILFQQEEVIMATINREFPGMLSAANSSSCTCDQGKSEEKAADLKYKLVPISEDDTEVCSTYSQTVLEMVDGFCQTTGAVQSSITMLDVAVQTLANILEEEEPLGVRVGKIEFLKEEKENVTMKKAEVSTTAAPEENRMKFEDGESNFDDDDDDEEVEEEEDSDSTNDVSSSRIQQLLEASAKGKGKNNDGFPCQLCKKVFSSLFSVKTHIYVTHSETLKGKQGPSREEAVESVVDDHDEESESPPNCVNQNGIPNDKPAKSNTAKSNARKGFNSKFAYSKPKKRLFSNPKRSFWCRYCWMRFTSKEKYEEHRLNEHKDHMKGSGTSSETSSRPSTPRAGASPTKSDVGELLGCKTIRYNLPVRLELRSDEGATIMDILPSEESVPLDSSPTVSYMRDQGQKRKRSFDHVAETGCDDESSNHFNVNKKERSQTPESGTIRPLSVQLVKVDEKLKIDQDGVLHLENGQDDAQANDSDDEDDLMEDDEKDIFGEETEHNRAGSDDEFTSLPWYEGRLHSCLMCEKQVQLGSFSTHVLEVHNVSMFIYRDQFPHDNFGVRPWDCTLCHRPLKWTQPSISRHLRNSHGVNLQEFSASVMEGKPMVKQVRQDLTLPWYECRAITCKICDDQLSVSKIIEHLRSRHSITYEDYKILFPMNDVKLPLWKCLVCNIHVKWTKKAIKLHITKHDLSLKQYCDSYVIDAEMPKPVSQEPKPQETGQSKQRANQILANVECVLKEEEDNEMSSDKDEMSESDATFSSSKLVIDEPNSGGSTSTGNSRATVWVPWFESRLHSCLICGETRTCGLSFKNHLYDRHNNMSRKDYTKQFPDADIEPHQWTCTVCNSKVKWTKKCIVDHLKSAHSMSREEFEEMYGVEPKHLVEAPNLDEGGINFNVRTDLCLANSGKKEGAVGSGSGPGWRSAASATGGNNRRKESNGNDDNGSAKPAMTNVPQSCSLCDGRTSNFRDHIVNYHKMTQDAYLRICPQDADKFRKSPSGKEDASKKRKEASKPIEVREEVQVASIWTCNICEEMLEHTSKGIKNHLDNQHSMDVKEYVKAFPEDDSLKDIVNRESSPDEEEDDEQRLVICDIEGDGDTGLPNETAADAVLSQKEEPVKKVRDPGYIWYETVKIKCRKCGLRFWQGQFMKHIILSHKLTIKMYRARYPDTDIPKIQYQCRICGVSMSHYASPISGHLSGKHNMTMTQYYEQYEKLKVPPPKSSPAPGSPSSRQLNKKSSDSIQATNMRLLKRALEESPSHNHLASTSADPLAPVAKTMRMADFQKTGVIPWYESRIHKCRLCGEEWLLGSFRRHLYDRHEKLSRTGYKEMFADADIELPTWTCGMCGNEVKWMRDNIFYHLRTHNLSLDAYKKAFIDLNNDQKRPKPGDVNEDGVAQVRGNGGGKAHKKFRCKICSNLVTFSTDAIRLHLAKFHNMTLREYQPLYKKSAASEQRGGGDAGNDRDSEGVSFPTAIKKEQPDPLATDVKQEPGESDDIHDVMKSMPNLYRTLTQQSSSHHQHSSATTNNSGGKSAAGGDVDAGAATGIWYNRCKWTCAICSRTFCSGFWRHVAEEHSVKKEEYLARYGKRGIEIVQYECGICGKKVPWSGASINAHTKTEHGMSLKEYEVTYGPKNDDAAADDRPTIKEEKVDGEAAEATPAAGGSEERSLRSIQLELEKHQQQMGQAATSLTSQLLHQRSQLQQQQLPLYHQQFSRLTRFQQEMDKHTVKQQGQEKWFNGCEYQCQICHRNLFSIAGLSLHLREVHHTDKVAYFEQYGRTGITIRKYQCKICRKTFPWSGVSISKHVKQSHSMSLQRYSALHEKPVVLGSQAKGSLQKEFNSSIDPMISDGDGSSGANKGGDGNDNLNLSQASTKDKWYNKCSWTCQICNSVIITNSSAFYKHVVTDHQVAIDKYKEQYGNAGFAYVDHTCKLCNKRVPCNGLSMCKHFKHAHNMTLEEYENKHMADDDGSSISATYEPSEEFWYNKCLWRCQLCPNKNRSLGSFKKHITRVHRTTYEDYSLEFGTEGVIEVEFTCMICDATMLCNGVTIASHLLNNHKLTLGDYEHKYLRSVTTADGEGAATADKEEPPEQDQESTGRRKPKSGATDRRESSTAADEMANEELVNAFFGNHFLAQRGEEMTSSAQTTSKNMLKRCPAASTFDTGTDKVRPWYQKCKYICQVCRNAYFSISALRNHVKTKHNMEREDYINTFGDHTGRIIEDYTCKICHRVLKCEGRSLNAHMRNCHKMGIREYSRKYESQDQTYGDPECANESYQIEIEREDDYDCGVEVEGEEDPLQTDDTMQDDQFAISGQYEDEYSENSLFGPVEEEMEDDSLMDIKPDIGQLNMMLNEHEEDPVQTTDTPILKTILMQERNIAMPRPDQLQSQEAGRPQVGLEENATEFQDEETMDYVLEDGDEHIVADDQENLFSEQIDDEGYVFDDEEDTLDPEDHYGSASAIHGDADELYDQQGEEDGIYEQEGGTDEQLYHHQEGEEVSHHEDGVVETEFEGHDNPLEPDGDGDGRIEEHPDNIDSSAQDES